MSFNVQGIAVAVLGLTFALVSTSDAEAKVGRHSRGHRASGRSARHHRVHARHRVAHRHRHRAHARHRQVRHARHLRRGYAGLFGRSFNRSSYRSGYSGFGNWNGFPGGYYPFLGSYYPGNSVPEVVTADDPYEDGEAMGSPVSPLFGSFYNPGYLGNGYGGYGYTPPVYGRWYGYNGIHGHFGGFRR